MSAPNDKWFEVWYDEGSDLLPAYFLIVIPDVDNPGFVQVYDPFDKKFVKQGLDYRNTRIWLAEDEYRLVAGRVAADNGPFMSTGSKY